MDIKNFFQDCLLVIFLLNIHRGDCAFEDDYEDGPTFGRCPWIRDKLKNGRVRYRYKGRIAKFLCDSGYELAGKRSSTCVRGQWSNPVPVCVARGCSRVPSIANGRVTETYRGALLVYDCNPGYTLDGESSIHCNGRRWNTSPPVCGVSTSDPETQCDFESPDLCGWTHDPTHDFDWKRHQFATPSGHVGTGPSHDHTFGEHKAGYYLYIESSSPRKLNDTARLFSPVYPADQSGGCFIFWYHMYGDTTGGLRVYLKPESHVFGELSPKWEKFSDQGNQWIRGNIDVPSLSENFQIVIEGIRGVSYIGDSAIDDVQLTKLDCESMENITDIATEATIAESCRGRCRGADSVSACGCNENCYAVENCCSDYISLCTEGNDTFVQNTDEPLPGDYYGKTTSPATVTIPLTSLQPTEKQTLTSLSTILSQSASQSTAVSSTASLPVTNSTVLLYPNTVQSSTLTPAVIPSTEATTFTSTVTTFITESSTAQIKPEIVLSTTAVPTIAITFPKPNTTVLNTTPIPTTMKSTLATTSSLKTSSSVKTTIMTSTISSTTSEQTTKEPKTSKLPVLTTTTVATMVTTTPVPTSTSTNTSTQSTTVLTVVPVSISQFESSSINSSSNSTTVEPVPLSSSSTIPETSTPRYNLRPRKTTVTTPPTIALSNPTTLKYSSSITKGTSISSPSTTVNPQKTKILPETVPVSPLVSSTSQPRRWLNVTAFSTSSTQTTTKMTTKKASIRSSTSTQNIPETSKATFRIPKPTPFTLSSSLSTTQESYEMSASKAESSEDSGSSAIVISVIVIAIICLAGVAAYYLRKYRGKRQSKLDDDSEMRFLPENDFMDYSDASALDKILVQ